MENKIKEIMAEFMEKVPEDVHYNLIEERLMDSMMMINLLTAIEDEFGIEIEVKDISKDNFMSISAIAQMIKKYVV